MPYYLENWSLLEVSEGTLLAHFVEILRRAEDIKGGDIELLDSEGKANRKVFGKVTSLHQFETLCSLLGSMLTISLFCSEFETRGELMVKLNELSEKILKESIKRNKLHPFFDEIVTHSSQILISKQYSENAQFRVFLTSQLCFLGDTIKDSAKDVFEHWKYKQDLAKVDSSSKAPLFPVQAEDTGEFCFIYEYAKQLMFLDTSKVDQFFADVIGRLSHIKTYLNEKPIPGSKCALAFLMLMNLFLNKLPVFDNKTLAKLLLRLYLFVNLPDPMGSDFTL